MAGESADERTVRDVLSTLPVEWFVIHDLQWPGRRKANVDHVVVGPGGVFVVDTKNWSGDVAVRAGVLRQNGYSRATTVEGVRSATDAIAALVPSLDTEAFTPVICFAGEGRVEANLDGVLVCHADSLIELLTSRRPLLSMEWVEFLRFDLDMSTRGALEPRPAVGGPSAESRPAAVPSPRRGGMRGLWRRLFLTVALLGVGAAD
jgi:hypothetical protein